MPALPQRLVRFIRADIHSVLQLEVLLLLRQRGGDWSVVEMAKELRITPQAVEGHARSLREHGLLSHAAQGDRYAFAPQDERLRSLVDELAACDGSMRHVVINLIFPGDRGSSPSGDGGGGKGSSG